jgi:hypothetical protein
MFIPGPDLDFLPIPDPGSRGQKGTGSQIRNTATNNRLYTVLYSSYRTGEPRPAAAQAGEVPGAQARHHLRRDVQGRVGKNPSFFKNNPTQWFFCFFFVFVFLFFSYICPVERVFRVFQFQEYFKVHPDFKL